MRKLRYVNRTARILGETEPAIRLASTDITVEEMDMTVEEFFRRNHLEVAPVNVALENDLPDFFIRKGRRTRGIRPAWEMIRQHRAALINKIEYWTGVRRSVVRSLVDSIEQAAERLQLYIESVVEPETLVELTTYSTTLSMNYLTRGSFVPRARQPLPVSRRPGREGKDGIDGEASHRARPRP